MSQEIGVQLSVLFCCGYRLNLPISFEVTLLTLAQSSKKTVCIFDGTHCFNMTAQHALVYLSMHILIQGAVYLHFDVHFQSTQYQEK